MAMRRPCMALARAGALGLSPPGLIAIWSGGGADFTRAITACAVAIAFGFRALIPGRSGAFRIGDRVEIGP